jgi:S1-C subfamily serine protease
MPVDPILLACSRIECIDHGTTVSQASGFFYDFDDSLYFITNRHVVIDEEDDFRPSYIRLRLHTGGDIGNNGTYRIPLYDGNNDRVWMEYPDPRLNIDVVAVPLEEDEVTSTFVVAALSPGRHVPDEVVVGVGHDLQVIGYPEGFHDRVHNLPVVRNASLASAYGVPFENRPFVLVDSNLHDGTSGSPVMTKPQSMISKTGGSVAYYDRPTSFFVGVHSATMSMTGMAEDEDLGLNVVWFAGLIPEIIQGRN